MHELKVLSFEQMDKIHQETLLELEKDQVGQELYDELEEVTAYAKIWAKWL